MLKIGSAYDEDKYLAALARRGSPLNWVLLAATAPRCEIVRNWSSFKTD